MHIVIQAIQVVLSVTLITLVMIQSEGSGLGGSLFGGGEVYHSKRGIERSLFVLTVVVAVLFTVSSIGNVVLS